MAGASAAPVRPFDALALRFDAASFAAAADLLTAAPARFTCCTAKCINMIVSPGATVTLCHSVLIPPRGANDTADKARGEAGFVVEADDAAGDEGGAEDVVVHHAEAGEFEAWIDAEDAHGEKVRPGAEKAMRPACGMTNDEIRMTNQ